MKPDASFVILMCIFFSKDGRIHVIFTQKQSGCNKLVFVEVFQLPWSIKAHLSCELELLGDFTGDWI